MPLFVLVVLVVVEVGVRAVESRLSADIEHIKSIGGIVTDLARASEAANERSVLFIGNSLTRRGVNLEAFAETLEREGVDGVRLASVYPDDTTALDWIYLYRNQVESLDAVPDVVVVSFGFWHLEDRPLTRAQTYRLGRYYTGWSDLPGIFREDVTALADRVNVLLSKVSAAFANRERIAQRVLSFLPYYQESARMINDRVRAANGDEDNGDTIKSYERLELLIRSVEDSGAQLVLIAMPTRDGYHLDPRITEIAAAHGATLIDAREVPGLSADQFLDGIHLDPETGATTYSEYGARLLAPVLESFWADGAGPP